MAARTLRYWILACRSPLASRPLALSRSLTLSRCVATSLGMVLLLCAATTAVAQQKVNLAQVAKLPDVKQILRGGDLNAADRKVVDDYLNQFFLPQFVTPTPKYFTLDDLPKVRGQLKILQTTAKGAALDHLNDVVLNKMKGIIGGGPYGEYDTAIKYNAMLVIADLNEPAAFNLMLAVMQSPKSPDYLKTAALMGLQRVAMANEAPKEKTAELTKVMLEVLTQETPPGRSVATQNFLRRRAGQTLAALGNPGPNNSVVKALEVIAADPKARPIQRCEMAQFLGDIKYPPTAKADLERLSSVMGHQAVEICKHELERAKAENRDPSRRLILYSLYSTAGVGLKGLAAAADSDPDTKAKINQIKSKLTALYTELNDPEVKDGDVADIVEAKVAEIEGVLPAKPAAAEPLAAAGKDQPVKPADKTN